jgi:transposase-like protein
VKSLEEGLEETLTIHRIGLHRELRRSFSTTNIIESIHALVEQATSKVDHWKNSSQKQRWVATALLDIAQRLNRVCGYRQLRMLRTALQNELHLQQTNQGKEVVAA